MRRLTIASAVFVLIVTQSRIAWSTSGWLVVNEKTIEGSWVALDQESGEVCRLRIRGSEAVLVITAGPAQSEFVFRSNSLSVKKGRFSATMSKEPGGWTLDVVGEGRADTMNGFLTLRMHFAKQTVFPGSDRNVTFVKECCRSIAEVLAKNDKRARALIEGAVKANEPEVLAPAAGSDSGGHSGQPTKAIRDASAL